MAKYEIEVVDTRRLLLTLDTDSPQKAEKVRDILQKCYSPEQLVTIQDTGLNKVLADRNLGELLYSEELDGNATYKIIKVTEDN